MAEQNPTRWQIDKKISVGHLLTIVALLVSVMTYTNAMDKRIAENQLTIKSEAGKTTTAIAYLAKRQDDQEKVSLEFRKEIRAWMRSIDKKISY